jgi:hemerythrin
MHIDWDSKLDTGIEVIDSQHKRIVEYINELEAAKVVGDRQRCNEVIEQLIDYTESHFGFEEAMMEEAGYKFLKPHKKVHELFIRRVTEITLRSAKGEEILEELQSVLTKWLLNHIANEDRDYAQLVLEATGGKPKVAVTADLPPASSGFFSGLVKRLFH